MGLWGGAWWTSVVGVRTCGLGGVGGELILSFFWMLGCVLVGGLVALLFWFVDRLVEKGRQKGTVGYKA